MHGGGWWRLGRRAFAIVVPAIVALTLISLMSPVSAAGSQTVHGAGLVIRHGNGKIVYAYVEFKGNKISGAELLARSGLPAKISPVPGLGEEVCKIQQEGCPPSNCYCESYASPAYYWHYYRLDASGAWVYQQTGPTTSVVHDGDVDGWAWTTGQPDLPKTSIDQIAKLNGVRRPATPAAATPTAPAPGAPPATAPIPTVTSAAIVSAPASPAARVVEGNGSGKLTPLQTKSKAGSSSPDAATLAEIALAVVILAGAATWTVLRRRRGAP